MNVISSFLFNATINLVYQFITFVNKNSNKYNFSKLYIQLRAKFITQHYIFFSHISKKHYFSKKVKKLSSMLKTNKNKLFFVNNIFVELRTQRRQISKFKNVIKVFRANS